MNDRNISINENMGLDKAVNVSVFSPSYHSDKNIKKIAIPHFKNYFTDDYNEDWFK